MTLIRRRNYTKRSAEATNQLEDYNQQLRDLRRIALNGQAANAGAPLPLLFP